MSIHRFINYKFALIKKLVKLKSWLIGHEDKEFFYAKLTGNLIYNAIVLVDFTSFLVHFTKMLLVIEYFFVDVCSEILIFSGLVNMLLTQWMSSLGSHLFAQNILTWSIFLGLIILEQSAYGNILTWAENNSFSVLNAESRWYPQPITWAPFRVAILSFEYSNGDNCTSEISEGYSAATWKVDFVIISIFN